ARAFPRRSGRDATGRSGRDVGPRPRRRARRAPGRADAAAGRPRALAAAGSPLGMSATMRQEDIAVVGLSCRFPGAPTARDYWRLLRDGREGARVLDDESLLARGVARRIFSRPDYVRVCADIPDIEWFDAAFFGCGPAE